MQLHESSESTAVGVCAIINCNSTKLPSLNSCANLLFGEGWVSFAGFVSWSGIILDLVFVFESIDKYDICTNHSYRTLPRIRRIDYHPPYSLNH